MSNADLGSLDGRSAAKPRYILLAGDVEVFLGPTDVAERLLPVLEWIEQHRG